LARSDVSFLKGIRPHRLSRIIVSTLPDELQQGSNTYIFLLKKIHLNQGQ
jgi:hypothetical protein